MRNVGFLLLLLALAVVFAQPTIVWQRSLGGSDWDVASSVQQTTDGGFVVVGESESNDGDVTGNHGIGDYWVVKLSPDDGISEKQLPTQFAINAFPNPFNSSVRIVVSTPSVSPPYQGGDVERSETEGVRIEICDLRGNVVYEPPIPLMRDLSPLLRGTVPTCRDRGFVWTPNKSIPSGIYLIRATMNGRTITKRAILMK